MNEKHLCRNIFFITWKHVSKQILSFCSQKYFVRMLVVDLNFICDLFDSLLLYPRIGNTIHRIFINRNSFYKNITLFSKNTKTFKHTNKFYIYKRNSNSSKFRCFKHWVFQLRYFCFAIQQRIKKWKTPKCILHSG